MHGRPCSAQAPLKRSYGALPAHRVHLQVYNVTSGKSLPQWLSEKKRRALRKDAEFTRRLELLQDFGFPAACQRVKVSPDQQYIFATGYHPPMVRHMLHLHTPCRSIAAVRTGPGVVAHLIQQQGGSILQVAVPAVGAACMEVHLVASDSSCGGSSRVAAGKEELFSPCLILR